MNFSQVSASRARQALTVVWIFFFAANVTVLFALYFGEWIEKDNFWAMLAQINALYVTYLATILGCSLTRSKHEKTAPHNRQAPFGIALFCSMFWNIAVSSFIFRVVSLHGRIEDAIKQVGYVGPLLSWLVAPVVSSYLFHSTSSRNKE
jgi:hypothetical protein